MAGVDLWLIVGARRWARIVAAELCGLLGSDASVHLEANRDADPELQDWWRNSPFRKRIEIVDQPAPCRPSKTGVALIVNPAYQHAATIERMLSAGYNVVSEKPLSFSRNESVRLLSLCDELGLKLYSTNTYLFADYLQVFKRDRLEGRTISEIQLTWADPTREHRHGQEKSYDSTVPIIFDVLPHIATIVLATQGDVKLNHSELTVRQGGSAVAARFVCGDLLIQADMRRNSNQRIRLARFSGPTSAVTIDFSVEPGVVWSDGNKPACADPSWPTKRMPIAEMLRSVKTCFEDGAMDNRLHAKAALLGNELIDAVADSYVQQQIDLLAGQRRLQVPAPAMGFAYAAKEAHSISVRALPFLPKDSPLRRLTTCSLAGQATHSEHGSPGRSL